MIARASSCVGDSWNHAMFKIKYCHKVFAINEVRAYVLELIYLVSTLHNMPVKKIGFDDDHVHLYVNIRLRSKPEAAKLFKGITGKKVFEQFPEIKRKYFWDSGFWNPSYWMNNVGANEQETEDYIMNQKYSY